MINLEMNTQSEETITAIVQRAQSGDQSAFMELVDHFSGMAYAAAYAIVRNKEDAEDAVQEALMQAYRYLHTLDQPTRFAPWLRSIVRQQCCGFIRLWKRQVQALERIYSERFSGWLVSQPECPSVTAFQREVWERSLSALSRRSREIALLYYLEGYTCTHIAELLQLSEGAVKSHLHKARKRMENLLNKLGIQSTDCLSSNRPVKEQW